MTAATAENADPNLSLARGASLSPAKPAVGAAAAAAVGRPPRATKRGLRVSLSPKAKLSPGARARRRRSSSRFERKKKLAVDTDEGEGEESDIEFTLDGAADLGGKATVGGGLTPTPKAGKKKADKKHRRRRRSSARFLAAGADEDAAASPKAAEDEHTSSAHLGEIYRQAIRMNAENKINAGNSWGLRLIENMDKFLVEGGEDHSPESTPRSDGREELKAARKMKSRDEKGRVNFTKASCTLDASVKIYSYRVDDVHLSSYRVLANLNRTDTKKDDGVVDADGEAVEGTEKTTRRRAHKGPTETLEGNMANINMSRLDSAYDIDPLFHKMSKSFDEGGAKGLLLGNLGVSHDGCRIVFDSKEDDHDDVNVEEKLETVDEENDEDEAAKEANSEEEFDITPEEATVWKESEVDITALASKLSAMLASYGHASSSSVPFVPQLESLRQDYAALEEEGYGVDEKDAGAGERKRLRLYDAPDDEEKEAERSIHVIAMERSRGSVLGMSFDTNFRLSLGGDDDDDDADFGGGGGGEFALDDVGGEGEFAPDEGEFAPDFGGGDDGGGFDAGSDSQPGTFVDARSYANTKVLLDALCDGDAFYDGNTGGNGDYAFFDMKKLEKATDGNLWAGSQHWKKKPALKKDGTKVGEKKRVMFDDGEGEQVEKKERKKAVKKDRVFIDFAEAPDIDSIFEKKNAAKRTKKSKKDAYQMPKTEKDFLLPPDAGVDVSQLARLFSRPKAVVRRVDVDAEGPVGKTVGFHDVEDNMIGFDDNDDGDFGGNDGGFTFAYGDEDDDQAGTGDDADYNLDDFDDVRKVEKIDVKYATVAKKVDVRRLKRDLWAELEEKTAWIPPEDLDEDKAAEEEKEDDIFEEAEKAAAKKKGDPQYVSFKQTIEKMETAQKQDDVTVSFYFICCLHLANEKGLKLDSTGLEDFVISQDDGSAPAFGTFGDGFSQTANKLKASGIASSRGMRETKKMANYDEGSDGEEVQEE